MAERLGALGYCALKKETTKGTAITPTVYYPIYEESMTTNMNFDEDAPIVGNAAELFQVLPGQRTHTGNITFHGEPNVAGYIVDMLATKGVTSGSDPYTHPFTFSHTTLPNSYTIDILKGPVVFRYVGCEVHELTAEFSDNTMRLTPEITARHAFTMREIATVSGSGPTTVNFKSNDTDYVSEVDKELVVGDLVQYYDAGTPANGWTTGVVASLVDDDTITVTQDWSGAAAGDFVALRTATPSYSLKAPFQEARTEFRFGADAAAALTATHTPVEKGAGKWTVRNAILPAEGALRTGSHDPASLPRGRHGADVNTKIFFDTPDDYNRYQSIDKRALVVRHFVTDTAKAYELRLTFNNLRMTENPTVLNAEDLIFSENTYKACYDTSDASAVAIDVLNAIATI